MLRVEILIIVLIVSTVGQENMQRRQLYYSDDDYACQNSPPSRKDLIYLNIIYDNNVHMLILADGGTNCYEFSFKPSEQVSPGTYWDYLDYVGDYKDRTWIRFNQTVEYSYRHGLFGSKKLKSIVATSKVFNPTIIHDVPYECNLVDNGRV